MKKILVGCLLMMYGTYLQGGTAIAGTKKKSSASQVHDLELYIGKELALLRTGNKVALQSYIDKQVLENKNGKK